MKQTRIEKDVVVIGGGLAGFAAAVSAARHGAQTILIQDRPVLGGNASSEIRVTPHGAGLHHNYATETGLMAEAAAAERSRCHIEPMENAWTNSQWDLALYDICKRTPNLTLQMNTSLTDVILEDGTRGSTLDPEDSKVSQDAGYMERSAINPSRRISRIECSVANAETQITVVGKQYIDCTGDGLCAHLAGCSWRWGSEASDEFDEIHAPSRPDALTMGSSIQFYCHDAGKPVPYEAPPWAKKLNDPDFFYGGTGRIPYTPRGGFWWIEIGVPYNTIFDNEPIREELTEWTLGIWDWMKNKDEKMREKCANYVLDWVGQVPGKRESRRIMGKYFINENELKLDRAFEDEIAYGGWFIDLHTPGGLLAENAEPGAATGYDSHNIEAAKGHVGPYGIPLGILQSRDIDNLGMAGRDVSATKAALGSIRVMQTCGLLGQAIGTAAAVALREGRDLTDLSTGQVREVQDHLRRDGVFLPNVNREAEGDLVPDATLSASSEALLATTSVELEPSKQCDGRPFEQPSDLAQCIPVAGPRLDAIRLCLSSSREGPIEVPVVLRHVKSIWHYDQVDGEVLAEGTLTVEPGQAQWVRWDLGMELPETLHDGGYVRLELMMTAPGELWWERVSRPALACPAYYLLPCADPNKRGERYRRIFNEGMESYGFAVEPAMPVFRAENVRRSANRPYRDAGMWRSDPAEPLPQYLECRWSEPKTLRQIELQFGGDLSNELCRNAPLSRDREVVADYEILLETKDGWEVVDSVRANCQHHRFHQLAEPAETSAVRIRVTGTNGSESASISNLRIFSELGDYPDPWGM
ncbi:MAG TPA: hypothetical protein DEA90_06335 [Opitutae bacterium]|nr:hypothetical protein [Puniceicoccaceae bacterium]HBR93765.1 hypothetical protein [Opitutae bacterium]